MVIDADTDSDPTVVIGSTNWSNNGEEVNDENMILLHDRALANQVRQEFEARWASSGCKE
jgi:phosphatidylserine/phosphatidylglycerophosphate/cardiolipin synthase-like enzyme